MQNMIVCVDMCKCNKKKVFEKTAFGRTVCGLQFVRDGWCSSSVASAVATMNYLGKPETETAERTRKRIILGIAKKAAEGETGVRV